MPCLSQANSPPIRRIEEIGKRATVDADRPFAECTVGAPTGARKDSRAAHNSDQ